jgi:hypothetical protein
MSRIFLLLMLFVATIGLSGCNRATASRAAEPDQFAAIIEPFFAAVRRGDQKAAEKYVASGFLDDSKVQFAEKSALLKKSPRLESFIHQPQKNVHFLTFAGQDGASWITMEVRLARYDDKHMIDYWDVNVTKTPPEIVAHAQTVKNVMENVMNYGLMAVGIIALAGLAALIWLVRNRTHLVAPEPVNETRRVAATVRDSDI